MYQIVLSKHYTLFICPQRNCLRNFKWVAWLNWFFRVKSSTCGLFRTSSLKNVLLAIKLISKGIYLCILIKSVVNVCKFWLICQILEKRGQPTWSCSVFCILSNWLGAILFRCIKSYVYSHNKGTILVLSMFLCRSRDLWLVNQRKLGGILPKSASSSWLKQEILIANRSVCRESTYCKIKIAVVLLGDTLGFAMWALKNKFRPTPNFTQTLRSYFAIYGFFRVFNARKICIYRNCWL